MALPSQADLEALVDYMIAARRASDRVAALERVFMSIHDARRDAEMRKGKAVQQQHALSDWLDRWARDEAEKQRGEQMKKWVRDGLVYVTSFLNPAQGSHTVQCKVGDSVYEEDSRDFPSKLLIAQIYMAIEYNPTVDRSLVGFQEQGPYYRNWAARNIQRVINALQFEYTISEWPARIPAEENK